jgi:preprotein translocase subunit SecE
MDKIKLLLSLAIFVAGIVVYTLLADTLTVYRVLAFLVALAIALGVFATSSYGKEGLSFFKSANIERRKVVWPTPTETTQATLMVVVMVIVLGLYLWLLDLLSFKFVYDLILNVPSRGA